MNKTQQLAQDRFGGDLYRAMLHIVSLPKQELELYAKEMSDKQLRVLMEVLNHKGLSEMTEEERVRELGRDYIRNKRRKMLYSREEFRDMAENPFRRSMPLSLALAAVLVLIPLTVLFLELLDAQSARYLTIGCAVAMTGFARSAAEQVSNYFKFKRYHRLYTDYLSEP